MAEQKKSGTGLLSKAKTASSIIKNLGAFTGTSSAVTGVAPSALKAGKVFSAIPSSTSATALSALPTGVAGLGGLVPGLAIGNAIASLIGINPFGGRPGRESAGMSLQFKKGGLSPYGSKNADGEQEKFTRVAGKDLYDTITHVIEKEGLSLPNFNLQFKTQFAPRSGESPVSLWLNGREWVTWDKKDNYETFRQKAITYVLDEINNPGLSKLPWHNPSSIQKPIGYIAPRKSLSEFSSAPDVSRNKYSNTYIEQQKRIKKNGLYGGKNYNYSAPKTNIVTPEKQKEASKNTTLSTGKQQPNQAGASPVTIGLLSQSSSLKNKGKFWNTRRRT